MRLIKHLKLQQTQFLPCSQSELTGRSSHASLQARSSSADLVRSSLPHGPHSKLEGAAGDVLAAVLDVDSVGSHFLGDEAHAVGAAPSVHNVSIQCFPTGAGHLSRHGLGATLDWRRQSSTDDVFRNNLDICT